MYPTPDNGSLSCPLVGKNLDKVAKLRLRNAKEPTETTTAEGTVGVTGDSTSATVVFQTPALRGLSQPVYNVFLVATNTVEQPTGQSLRFGLGPYLSKIVGSLDFSSAPTDTKSLVFTGYHLLSVDAVRFTIADAKTSKPVDISIGSDVAKTDTQIILSVKQADIAALGTASVSLSVSLMVKGQAVDTGQTVTLKPHASTTTPTPAKSTKATKGGKPSK
jgi:hypothetical protein